MKMLWANRAGVGNDSIPCNVEDLQLIAKNFEYPDEVKESFRVMGMMREDAVWSIDGL